ncbi:uncharacterized protein [Amphiura filiformis]|uniref:uncharacterized protein isoform X6 n=1 Tax=Amphiura filiformis TaxID=82378 RepID=UPI003B226630
MDEDQDQDDYVGQLREVFDQCDTEGNGALNRDGLLELCNSLQLQDQAEQLIGELLGDSTGGLVDFDTFKEAFVNILATTVDFDTDLDDIGGVSDVDRDDDDRSVSSYHNPVSDADIVDEVSPKYVKGNKKYGRRSKPDINVDTADISDVETDVSSYAGLPPDKSHHSKSEARGTKREGDRSEHGYHLSKRNSVSFADDLSQGGSLDLERELDFDQDPVIDGVDVPQEPLSPERVDGEGTSILETFEAEGQNNASISQYAGTPTQDQSQVAAIEAIWEEVGVGKDGFLDIDELKIVCEHIGMEDMDNEELDNLFVKLDEDKDGRVGFDEFLRGLFSHTASATPTPIPIGMSPAQRANLRRLAGSSMDDPYQRTTTPSILVSQSSKLFSMLDPNNLGYARPEDIEEQLEREGIDNPAEIMEILDINMEAGKVNLQDLSSRLENILLAKGDDDGVYQVALATYQGELKYIRSQLDIVTDERDHLKDDITEANHRNTKLAQEVDDRHNNILRQNEKQLQALEEQYQDKIISLQAQIEKERESLTTEELGVRESLEKEIEQWKAEDALGKEKILLLQKENGRLEEELVEATERLIENEKTIQKQQRDLEGFQELEERLADLESNREKVSKQQEEYFESNIKEYQEKIRLLQDKMDELTQENDLLKNQGTERKTRRRASKIHASKPGRIGSVLSDYVNKPNVQRRLSSSENESELEELDPNLRRLPARSGGDGTSNEEEDKKKLEEEREKWEAEMTELKEDHKKELEEARIMFEHECKDIEQKYKIEISGLEEEMELKKDEARNQFEKLRVEFKGEQAKLVEELERQFKSERTETHEKNEREKHSREEEIAREKADLRDELEAKYNKELDNRIAELKQQLLVEKTELENLLVKEKSDVEKDLLKAKNEAEMKLKQRELDFVKEKGELESEFGSEKSELLQNYNAKVHELEQIFLNGEAGLKGQLRQDFTNLLDQHKAEMEESYKKEREELKESHEREKEEMNHAFELERVELLNGKENERSDIVERLQKEKAELVNKNKKDKLEAFEKHRREKAEMTEKFKKEKDALNEKHKKERSEWDQKLQKERERFRKEREDREEKFQRELAALELNLSVDKDNLEHTIRMDVEEKIRQDLKTEMEGDYVEQMHRLKENFEDEKSEFIVEKEEMEDRLRAISVSQVETIAKPMVAQEVHTNRPMPIGGAEPHAKSVSVYSQTDEAYPSTDELMEEKKDLEKRLRDAQALTNDVAHTQRTDFSDLENFHQKRKFIDEDSQTEGVELVDNTTSTTLDKEVDDEEMEVESGPIDNIQKFFTGLFKDGPRAKGIQTEIKPLTERISQTDINGKYFQQKFILEQKLRDTEALSDEMTKTILAMTYTEKEWEKARRLQRLDEYVQTEIIEMFDKECLTDPADDKVFQMVYQETMTDDDLQALNEVPMRDEMKLKLADAQTMTDEQEGVQEQLEAMSTEMLQSKTPPKDKVADLFAQNHLAALRASKRPKRQNPFLRDQNRDEQPLLDDSLNEQPGDVIDRMEDGNLTDTSGDDISSVKAKVKELEVEKQVLEEKLQAVSGECRMMFDYCWLF